MHLSKIDMPELRPRALAGSRRPSETGSARASSPDRPAQELSEKERRRLEKESKKAEKRAKKEKEKEKESRGDKPPIPTPTSIPPQPHKLSKPTGSYHHPAHQVHPHQPSPSPAQLNNPAIYAAPPPSPPPPRHTRPRPVSMAIPMPTAQPGAMSFYGSGMPPPPPPPSSGPGAGNQSPLGGPSSNYRPGYLSMSPDGAGGGGRPTLFFQSSSGKGPVSALLDMWSKH